MGIRNYFRRSPPPPGVETKAILSQYYTALLNNGIGLYDRAQSWPVERAVSKGYERVSWVFKAVNTIAASFARTDIPFVYRSGTDYVDDHPYCRLLNRRANPMENAQVFRKRLLSQLLLSKPGVFCEVGLSNAGTPIRLDLLPPGRTRIIPGSFQPDGTIKEVDHYEVTRLDGSTYTVEAERVLWIRDPHPTDPYSGVTPLESAGLSVELDYFCRLYNVSFLRNDGRPGGVLGIEGEMEESEMNRTERKFDGGPMTAGRLAVIAGKVSYIDLATRPRDLAYAQLSKNSKDEILTAFGTPESVLGNASGRTFSNADTETFVFWSVTMANYLSLVSSEFDDDSADDLIPCFNTTAVDVLQLPLREKRQEMREEVAAGLRSVKSYADAAGYGDEIPSNAYTQGLRQPSGVIIVPVAGSTGGASRAYEPITATGGSREPDPSPTAAVAAQAQPRELEPAPDPAPADAPPADITPRLSEVVEDKSAAPARPTRVLVQPQDTQTPASTALASALTTVIHTWSKRTAARVKSPKARKGTRHWEPDATYPVDTRIGVKALDVAAAADTDTAADTAEQHSRPLLESAAVAAVVAYLGAAAAAGLIPDTVTVTSWADVAAVFGATAASRAADEVASAVSAAVAWIGSGAGYQALRAAQAAAAADAAGKSVSEILDLLDEQAEHAHRWAQTISETATKTVTEAAHAHTAALVAAATGGQVSKTWRTRRDERVRPDHERADDQKQPLAGVFTVGGVALRWPGDPLGPPEQVRNCRCRVLYRHQRTGRFLTGVPDAA